MNEDELKDFNEGFIFFQQTLQHLKNWSPVKAKEGIEKAEKIVSKYTTKIESDNLDLIMGGFFVAHAISALMLKDNDSASRYASKFRNISSDFNDFYEVINRFIVKGFVPEQLNVLIDDFTSDFTSDAP